jgi:hypothetical protein
MTNSSEPDATVTVDEGPLPVATLTAENGVSGSTYKYSAAIKIAF